LGLWVRRNLSNAWPIGGGIHGQGQGAWGSARTPLHGLGSNSLRPKPTNTLGVTWTCCILCPYGLMLRALEFAVLLLLRVFPLFSFFSLPSFLQFCLFLAGFMPSCSYPLTCPWTFDPCGICMLRACMCRSSPKILGGQKHTCLRLQASTDAGESMTGKIRCPSSVTGSSAPHCTPGPCMLRALMYIHTPCP
jgi:hypothetical protein